MADLQSSLKTLLRALHLYQPARLAWSHRPDLRMALWNAGYRLAGTSDHLPLPPANLINLTVNSREVAWFLHSGMISFECLREVLVKNNYPLENFHHVLDFGCGCGRVLRYWRGVSGVHLAGSDYNPALINWDRSHLGRLADFQTNTLAPPLDYAENSFDLVYSLSVFTHFSEELQISWMDEMYRVLQPEGLLLVTLHGRSRIFELAQEQKARFLEGKVVVVSEESAGKNLCGAYDPPDYVLHHLARRFELVDFIEAGARDSNQDIYLLREPIFKS
jgi:SAM-dependent methyltransferase